MPVSEHCTVTATLRRFSSCDGEGSATTEYACNNKDFREYFEATFYANDSCVENEGHVSIVFNVIDANFYGFRKPVRFSCTASVIDASGNRRFPRSLALDLDYLHKEDRFFFKKGFGFDRYLKRSTLLGDAPELLPDDCLSLSLEIDYELIHNAYFKFWEYGNVASVFEDGRRYLRMDTEFGRELCEMSTVFRDMMECTTVESGPDRVQIEPEEFMSFLFIYHFLTGSKFEATVSDICKLYVLADKYDMQRIVQLCHRLLISVMREMNTREKLEYVDKDMHRISDLAERFEDDESLREILAIYSDIKNKNEGCSSELDAYKLETGWHCEYRREGTFFDSFVFRRKKKSEFLKTGIYK